MEKEEVTRWLEFYEDYLIIGKFSDVGKLGTGAGEEVKVTFKVAMV